MRTPLLLCGIALLTTLLAACGARPQQDTEALDAAGSARALPRPEVGSGSVTGMSQAPGPGDVPLGGEPPAAADDGAQAAIDLFNPEAGILPGGVDVDSRSTNDPTTPAAEPAPADAVAVLRDYYASIDSHSYARAYALWSGLGRASGQTPQQFANGFANTAQVSAEIGTPGSEDAGAGQRYLTIPVDVAARQADGGIRHFTGSYVLHRTIADGASAEQRAWRIASADLREVKP